MDTPIDRATINQLAIDELDVMLADIRDRRLQRVRQLEALAQVRADETQLVLFMKFERQLKRAQRAVAKLGEQEAKVEAIVHRARLLAVECGG